MKRILVASLAFILAINLSAQQRGTFKDSRDGKTYKTIKIGNQIWLAENLAYKPSSGNYWAYDNSSSNAAKYGYLYDWQTANNVCPTGWNLPSNTNWNDLALELGGDAGKELKSTMGWNENGNGTNTSGFSALPGGGRNSYDGNFNYIGISGYWWSSTERYSENAIYRTIDSNLDDLDAGNTDKSYGFSVRCIKD